MATYDSGQVIYASDKNFENLRKAFKNELDRRSAYAAAEAPNQHYKKYSTLNTATSESKNESISTTYANILNALSTNLLGSTSSLKSNYTTDDKIPALTNLYNIVNNLTGCNDSNTGCNASCVGFCSGSCYGSCSGCSNNTNTNAISGKKKDSEHKCGVGSLTSYGHGCGYEGPGQQCIDCGGCDYICGSGCSTNCSEFCYGNCGKRCNSTCTRGCNTSCAYGCQGGCSSNCSGSCLGGANVTNYSDWQA